MQPPQDHGPSEEQREPGKKIKWGAEPLHWPTALLLCPPLAEANSILQGSEVVSRAEFVSNQNRVEKSRELIKGVNTGKLAYFHMTLGIGRS